MKNKQQLNYSTADFRDVNQIMAFAVYALKFDE